MKLIDFSIDTVQTVQKLLKDDIGSVPSILLEEPCPDLGTADIPREIFISQHYHDLEVQHLWEKMWQASGREEDIPNVGDHFLYEVANHSIIVVRVTPNQIRAFHNVCLHRGTQLRTGNGNTRTFQCPFHGWKWNLDGSVNHIPCRWDFKHVDNDTFRLPEVKVNTWQGNIFLNFDPESGPLETYLENVPEHFKYIPFPLEDRFTAVRILKVMPANWKVTLEAFVESYHFSATHPQLLPFTGLAQYDIYGLHSRTILPSGVQSPHLGSSISHQALAEKLAAFEGSDSTTVHVPEGMTARSYAAQLARQRHQDAFGIDTSSMLDTEAIDVMSYWVFPNLILTPSLEFPLLIRVQPNGNDPDSSLMEVRVMLPCPSEGRPPSAKLHRLSKDEHWSSIPEFSKIGFVFDQDTANLERMQRGLKASVKPGITLGQYQESTIRHFHHVLDALLHPPL
jgi:phenylpropionate dioxygenase-like ring-hydroxylating dioxygenase large terminal subunit